MPHFWRIEKTEHFKCYQYKKTFLLAGWQLFFFWNCLHRGHKFSRKIVSIWRSFTKDPSIENQNKHKREYSPPWFIEFIISQSIWTISWRLYLAYFSTLVFQNIRAKNQTSSKRNSFFPLGMPLQAKFTASLASQLNPKSFFDEIFCFQIVAASNICFFSREMTKRHVRITVVGFEIFSSGNGDNNNHLHRHPWQK